MTRRTELRTKRGGLATEVDELAAALAAIEAFDPTTVSAQAAANSSASGKAAKAQAAVKHDPLGQMTAVDEWGDEEEWGEWLDGFVVEASKAPGEARPHGI